MMILTQSVGWVMELMEMMGMEVIMTRMMDRIVGMERTVVMVMLMMLMVVTEVSEMMEVMTVMVGLSGWVCRRWR